MPPSLCRARPWAQVLELDALRQAKTSSEVELEGARGAAEVGQKHAEHLRERCQQLEEQLAGARVGVESAERQQKLSEQSKKQAEAVLRSTQRAEASGAGGRESRAASRA